jgi:DNA topoisomerase IA
MQLVIVESPAKAKTIEKYLGRDFKVLASYGHVRDLPPKDGSVDPDDGFAMQWLLYPDKAKRMKEIQDAAKGADRLILATDPDREGEAISWHVQELLRSKKALPAAVDRVTFNAITKDAVLTAMAAPRALDDDLIDAYRARRALDYLVGFTLSPVLWRKLPGAKSAGRVQSVTLRMIVEREREIEAFVAQQYWSITGLFEMSGTPFRARLARWRGDSIDTADLRIPAVNMDMGQSYLQYLARDASTGGQLPKVIAAYNAGPAPIARWQSEIRDNGDPLLYMESIPYWETRGYVGIVLRNYWMYEAQQGKPSVSRAALAQGKWPRFPDGKDRTRLTYAGGLGNAD